MNDIEPNEWRESAVLGIDADEAARLLARCWNGRLHDAENIAIIGWRLRQPRFPEPHPEPQQA